MIGPASIIRVALLFLVTAATVQAQSGCVDSPEDPTAVLGALATGAAVGFAGLRKRKGSSVRQSRISARRGA